MYEHLRGGLRNQIPKFQNPAGPITTQGNPYITEGAGLQVPLPKPTFTVPQPNIPDKLQYFQTNQSKKKPSILTNGLNSAKSFLAQNAGQIANMGMSAVNSWATSGVEQGGFMNTMNGINNFMGNIPGGEKFKKFFGTVTTGLNVINKLGGRSIDKYQVDQNLMANMGGSYGGFSDLAQRAADATGKNYGLFNGGGYGKAKRLKNEAIRQENIVSDINSTSQDQLAMAGNDLNYTRYQFNQNGGLDQNLMRAAKFGSKLERIRRITSKQPEEPVEEFAEDLWEPQLFKEGGTIEENIEEDIFLEDSWEPQLFQEGGKTRTIQELIEYAKQQNPRFIQRLSEPPRGIDFIDDSGKKSRGSHYLESAGEYVIPRIQEVDGELKFFNHQDAVDRALETGNFLKMSPSEAIIFAEQYKQGWPKFFNSFQNGGKTKYSDLAKEYYSDYDLSNINIIEDKQPRAEGNNIYVSSDEDVIHELWHVLSNNKPNELYKQFYDSLNDNRIIELGGDLDFVKRTGDPNVFYDPSEIEARIKAAKYKTKGQNYTKDFFKELRSNENKFGYNMRDLLHMYNDENLEKIFNLKNGGELSKGESEQEETNQKNIIPEGALHKEKHHMENAEDLTKKGIPVIDNDGVQQAEIERDEIVFTLEVTKKLEDLYHKYYDQETSKKDDLAIEAGKILVYEILYNTEDRTNLISKCKEGGKLNET